MDVDPVDMSATAAAAAIDNGELTSEVLVEGCLARIDAREETVGAWTFLDREHALSQARAADQAKLAGRATGPLHGIPVGIKDIFDTDDMPTEDGTPLHAGHRPSDDATAVARLRQAGAIILGKTVTTELAAYTPGKTTNPHDPARTPGGSSSGSAAAVAAHMVPLAIGSQTAGSVIRPASFCGVFGFKPTHGLISRHNMLPLSRTLDQIGVFARTVEDAALLAEALIGFDANDPDTRPRARPTLREVARQEPPVTPHFGFVKGPAWDRAEDDTREAFAELVDLLGDGAEEIALPPVFADALDWHRTIMESEMAGNLRREYEQGGDRLSPRIRELIERGRTILAVDYNDAVAAIEVLNLLLLPVFERCDAILTPAAPGEAPRGLENTGDPAFCAIWTLCGVPTVTVPLFEGANGMPMGAQLVGPRGDDSRLLRTARWLAESAAAA